MDYTGIVQIISNLGFPIAMTIALFWKVHQQDKQHYEQLTVLKDAINNNTMVLTKLCEKMDKGEV